MQEQNIWSIIEIRCLKDRNGLLDEPKDVQLVLCVAPIILDCIYNRLNKQRKLRKKILPQLSFTIGFSVLLSGLLQVFVGKLCSLHCEYVVETAHWGGVGRSF